MVSTLTPVEVLEKSCSDQPSSQIPAPSVLSQWHSAQTTFSPSGFGCFLPISRECSSCKLNSCSLELKLDQFIYFLLRCDPAGQGPDSIWDLQRGFTEQLPSSNLPCSYCIVFHQFLLPGAQLIPFSLCKGELQ